MIQTFVDAWHNAGSIDEVRVQGFASEDGTPGPNWELSCRRAEAVANELAARGVATSRIKRIAHGESDKAPTAAGNRRTVISRAPVPGATTTQPPTTVSPPGQATCERVASIELSRGNDDFNECQYQTSVIRVELAIDPCACSLGGTIPLTIRFQATLDGKSFADPGRTVEERQASTIGQRMRLHEVNASPANISGLLTHTDLGRAGDPDDTLTAQLPLRQTPPCIGTSFRGEVHLRLGAFIAMVIEWTAAASSSGVQGASLVVSPRGGRLTPTLPLRSMASRYPAFPGTPRDSRCGCHPVTGIHTNASGNCPPGFL